MFPFFFIEMHNLKRIYTVGNNCGCNTTAATSQADYTLGFEACFGWDPVTGLGTPNFAMLRSAVGL